MKVCYVTHASNMTGANQSLMNLLDGLKNENIDIVVLVKENGLLVDKLKEKGIKFKKIRYAAQVKKNNVIINFLKILINSIATFRICQFFKKEKIEIVHNNSFLAGVGMEAAYRLNIPYICHLRECVREGHGVELLNEKQQFFLLQNANIVIAISEMIKKKYQMIANNSSLYIINDGIKCSDYLDKEKEIFSKEIITLILPGRFSFQKRQLDAVLAVEELYKQNIRNLQLILVGSPGNSKENQEYYKKVCNYVNTNNFLPVRIIDFVDNMKNLWAKSDIGLMCSSNEALGRVTIESMLAGCLTIGAASGGTIEIISDEKNGLLYEVGDYSDLAKKIEYAINNKQKMKDIAKEGQVYAKDKYDIEKYVHSIMSIYEKLV